MSYVLLINKANINKVLNSLSLRVFTRLFSLNKMELRQVLKENKKRKLY